MTDLAKRALTAVAQFQVALALLLFVPAWSVRFWEAWVYWVLFSLSVLVMTLRLLRLDPGLVENRLTVGPAAEHQESQKIIQTVASVLLCIMFAVPGIERHFRSSPIPAPLVLGADALVVVGFAIIYRVFRENSYAAAIVGIKPGQGVRYLTTNRDRLRRVLPEGAVPADSAAVVRIVPVAVRRQRAFE